MEKRRNTWGWWLLGAIIIVLIVGAVWFKDLERKGAKNDDADEQADSAEQQDAPLSFAYLLPDQWSSLDTAMEDIQILTPEQQITFGILPDPTDDSQVYFASYAPDPNEGEDILLSVYNYNTVTHEFERLFRRSYRNNFPGLHEDAKPIFHVVGYDDGKLIILAQDINDSPGPCTEVLTLGREKDDVAREMLAMNLDSPYDLMVPYSVPGEIYNEALQKQESCVNQ